MVVADSAAAVGKRPGILRRHRGVLTPQSTAASKKTKGSTPEPSSSSNTTRRPFARWKSRPTGSPGSPTSPARRRTSQKKQAAEDKLDLCLADPQRFAELKAIKDAGVRDPLLARQIAVLYLEFLGRQVPPELLKKISAKSNAVEREFNVYRYNVGGKKLTDNDISRILVESHDSAQRQAAWEARMTIGRAVARPI